MVSKWPNNDDLLLQARGSSQPCCTWIIVLSLRGRRKGTGEISLREDYGLHNALLQYSIKLPYCLDASLFIAVLIGHFNKRIGIAF